VAAVGLGVDEGHAHEHTLLEQAVVAHGDAHVREAHVLVDRAPVVVVGAGSAVGDRLIRVVAGRAVGAAGGLARRDLDVVEILRARRDLRLEPGLGGVEHVRGDLAELFLAGAERHRGLVEARQDGALHDGLVALAVTELPLVGRDRERHSAPHLGVEVLDVEDPVAVAEHAVGTAGSLVDNAVAVAIGVGLVDEAGHLVVDVGELLGRQTQAGVVGQELVVDDPVV
jgi:hypothetical protein